MNEPSLVVVSEEAGLLQAEILRGLLEAQGITVFLSQEGAGRALGLTVSPLGTVYVMVPAEQAERAFAILQEVQSGAFAELEADEEDDEVQGGEEEERF